MSIASPRRRAGAALLLLLLSVRVEAHPAPFSYVDLMLQRDRVDGTIVAHVFDLAHDLDLAIPETLLTPGEALRRRDAIVRLLSPRFDLRADGRPLTPTWGDLTVVADRQAVSLRFVARLEKSPGVLQFHCAMFPYDPNHQTFVNVYEHDRLTQQRILSSGQPDATYYPGSRQGALAVVARFLPAGIHHILIGPDHILFLIGLMLLGGRLRRLALIVSAFTLAHSVTLSLAALDLVSPPGRLIEPTIALSIVYVGADNLLVRGGRDVRAWIALGFGLVHGFGFARVLKEMELPARALGWSLFSFNLGVEVGQLVVVGLVASTLGVLRAHDERLGRLIAVGGSVVVIAAGAFWFVQRVFFTGGA